MGDKLFRSDLYYRLKVFPIITPPLRDHPEDIPILARHFTQEIRRHRWIKRSKKFPSDTMRALVSCGWPGNVRELENFIERSVILSRGPSLRAPLAEMRADADEDWRWPRLSKWSGITSCASSAKPAAWSAPPPPVSGCLAPP